MYEHPYQPGPTSPRGRRFGPALISVLVVLATMAGTMGYLVTRQIVSVDSRNGATGPGGTATPGPSANPGLTGSGTNAGTNPTAGSDPPSSAKPTPTPAVAESGMVCPPLTEKAVVDASLGGELTLLLYIRAKAPTTNLSDAEVWICRNSKGLLVYQGHVQNGPFRAVMSDVTLLLADGIRGHVEATGYGFVAINPGKGRGQTEYRVSRTELVQVSSSGVETHYPVEAAYPPA